MTRKSTVVTLSFSASSPRWRRAPAASIGKSTSKTECRVAAAADVHHRSRGFWPIFLGGGGGSHWGGGGGSGSHVGTGTSSGTSRGGFGATSGHGGSSGGHGSASS